LKWPSLTSSVLSIHETRNVISTEQLRKNYHQQHSPAHRQILTFNTSTVNSTTQSTAQQCNLNLYVSKSKECLPLNHTKTNGQRPSNQTSAWGWEQCGMNLWKSHREGNKRCGTRTGCLGNIEMKTNSMQSCYICASSGNKESVSNVFQIPMKM